MVKRFIILFTLSVLISSNLIIYASESNLSNELVLLLGTNKAYVNGNKQVIDQDDSNVKPILKNDRTLVPVRFISESFGANVKWDGKTKTVSINHDDKDIELIIGAQLIKVNDEIIVLDVAPEIINNRTFLPLRAFSESLGKEVFYDSGLIVISDQIVDYNENDVDQLISDLKDTQNVSEMSQVLILLIGSNQTFIDGNKQIIDSEDSNIKPIIKNSRTLVPVRYIAQSFGADVGWDNNTVSITQGDRNIEFQIGTYEMNLNGHMIQLDVAPEIINDRTYLPLRTISEAFEKNVFYDSGLIVISSYNIDYNDFNNHISYLKEELKYQPKTSTNIVSDTLDKVVLVETIVDGDVESFGSGFFIADGLIMTSFHVIEGYDEIKVTDILENEYTVDGVYSYNISQDIILLKLNKKQSVNYLRFGDLATPEIGDMVLALGNPQGLNWSVTQGIVSAFRENLLMGSYSIQTDATVSHGSSGGPLLNQKGEVIGIISKGIEYEDFNFAVIPHGINKKIEDYNKSGFENVQLVPESDFVFTEQEIQNVYKMIDDNTKGLLKNNSDLYLSTFHPGSGLLEYEKERFDESVKMLEVYEDHEIKDIVSSKYGDTIMSVGYVTLSKEEEKVNHIVVSRFMFDEISSQYKFMATFISKDVTNESDENIPDKTEVEDPPVVVDPTYKYYEELDFKPFDVKFDEEKGLIYMINKGGKSLVKYSIKDKKITQQRFDYIPERLHIDDGKVYVTLTVVGEHSPYLWEKDQEGYIGIVDADTLEVIKIIDIELDPYDVAAKDGYIYVTCGSGQWVKIKSFNEKTEMEIDSAGIRQASPVELHPFGDKLYTITTDSSPRDMKVYMINNGQFVSSYDSIYHGDYRMDVGFKLSPDGKHIYNNSGHVFKSGYGRGSDIIYYKKFNKPFNSVAFDIENNRLYMNVGERGTIYYYDYMTLEGLGTLQTQTKVNFMTVMDGKLITVENEDGNNGINVLGINSQ